MAPTLAVTVAPLVMVHRMTASPTFILLLVLTRTSRVNIGAGSAAVGIFIGISSPANMSLSLAKIDAPAPPALMVGVSPARLIISAQAMYPAVVAVVFCM